MRTALGYTRISKDDEKSVSLDYQRAEIERRCAQEGLTLTMIETDEGLSGKSIKGRPAVQRVLQAVDAREVDVVVVWKSDRMSRDGLESLQIEKLFLQKGVGYLSVMEGWLTSESVDDEFMSFIRAGLNQRERKLTAVRTRHALQMKRERGERIGGRPKYGWRVVNHELVPDPDEQEVLDRMRNLQTKGYSTREIVQELTKDGITTRKGTTWTQTQVVRVLKAA